MIIRSISGVRGITASHLTPDVIIAYTRALHTQLNPGVVIIGRDSRPSGDELLRVMVDEFLRLGRDVILVGIVPTPTVQFMVEHTEAVGGVIITASHNPGEWNGLKFVRPDGIFFHPDECETLFALADQQPDTAVADTPGMVWEDKNAIQKHIIHNVSLSCIDANAIRRRHFKVVIDAVNGGGADALPAMLDGLGCEVIELNCETTGEFLRGTEPLPENLEMLSRRVQETGADAGFAVDPDADRLAVVDNTGRPLGEEYTLVLAGDGYMRSTGQKEIFVVNLSTSLALEKLAETNGCTVERSAVGEINVVQKMQSLDANFGGEGNGGIILKEAHLGRDSMVGVTMVLNRLAQSEETLAQIYDTYPRFRIVKDKVQLEGLDADVVLKKAQTSIQDAEVNTEDGVKFTWEDRWVHLRKSNTEPILRIYAEGPTEKDARQLVDKIRSVILGND